jgi:predicted N-acyltransferase
MIYLTMPRGHQISEQELNWMKEFSQREQTFDDEVKKKIFTKNFFTKLGKKFLGKAAIGSSLFDGRCILD